MARRLTAIAISMVALSVSGCFPTSDDGTGGMAPVPCGGTCVTTPEAPAAADNAPWGLYKAIRLDYDYSAAVRIFVGQDDPMTTSTCEGRAGSHEVTCSPKYTDHNDLYISFSFTDDPDVLWYPGSISLSMLADGTIYNNYMVRKEKSTSLVQVFEGTTGIDVESAKVRFLGKVLTLPVSRTMLGRIGRRDETAGAVLLTITLIGPKMSAT